MPERSGAPSVDTPVYVSTGCLTGTEPLSERLARYAEHGLHAVELGAGVRAVDLGPKALVEWEGDLLLHNYFPPPPSPFVLNLASRNDEVRRRSRHLVRRALQWSSWLGSPHYSVHGGFVTDPRIEGDGSLSFPEPASPEEECKALDRFIDELEGLLEQADALGVDLLVENNACPEHLTGCLLLQTPAEFLELFDRVGHQRLGILLDTGHLNVSAATHDFEPERFLDLCASRVRALHLHANDGRSDQHWPLTEGDEWYLDFVSDPRVATCLPVIEARFDRVESLAEHVNELKRIRIHEQESPLQDQSQ